MFLLLLYLSMYTGVQHDFHVIWCSCCLTVTRRVSLVEQELLTLPEHLSPPPVLVMFVFLDLFVFCVVFCRSLFVLLSFFFFPLSVDLRILITPLVFSNSSYIIFDKYSIIHQHRYRHVGNINNTDRFNRFCKWISKTSIWVCSFHVRGICILGTHYDMKQ